MGGARHPRFGLRGPYHGWVSSTFPPSPNTRLSTVSGQGSSTGQHRARAAIPTFPSIPWTCSIPTAVPPAPWRAAGLMAGGSVGDPPHPPPFPQWRRRKHNKKNKIYKRGSNYSVATKGCLLRAIIMWLNLTPRAAVWGGGVWGGAASRDCEHPHRRRLLLPSLRAGQGSTAERQPRKP